MRRPKRKLVKRLLPTAVNTVDPLHPAALAFAQDAPYLHRHRLREPIPVRSRYASHYSLQDRRKDYNNQLCNFQRGQRRGFPHPLV